MDIKDTILKEISEFDSDVFLEFKNNYGAQIQEFTNHMECAHAQWKKIDILVQDDEERGYFSAVIFWAFSSQLQSFKLLCHGYQVPSGNLMRQSIEAIAFCVYCTDKSNGEMDKFKNGKVSTNKAITKLNKRLINKLGLNQEAVDMLKESRAYYDRYSHPSLSTIASCISFEGSEGIYVGGNYDRRKGESYEYEFELRVTLARDFPVIIKNIVAVIEKW